MEPDQPLQQAYPQAVPIDTVIPETQPVSIDTMTPGNPTPSAQTADVRSKKASFGLGELLRKSDAEIYQSIMSGQEKQLRAEASSRLDMINEQNRISNVVDLANRRGQTLTLEEMDALRKPPSDPRSVFEENYAGKYLDGIYKAAANMGDTPLDSVASAIPGVLKKDLDNGREHFGNYEYARSRQEDLAQQYENQGYLPWIADQLKNIIPFYSDIKLRGWLKDQSAFEGWLQGGNLEAQTRALLRMKGPEFRENFDNIINRLSKDNPTLALQYANAVLGMSTTEVALGNINNIIDIAGLPGLTKASLNVLRDLNATRVAIKDGVKSGNTARPDPANIAEGFGDTASASVERASAILKADVDGVYRPASNTANLNTVNDPIRRAQEALPTNFIMDKENIAANPGPLSRELLNRILQHQDVASKRIVEVIGQTAKVQQIPFEEASKIVLTRIKDEVRNQNGGIRNAIADVGDGVYNPYSNTYNFPVKLFNWTAEQFGSELQARKFAREAGLLEYDVIGKEGARYYLPEAAVKREFTSEYNPNYVKGGKEPEFITKPGSRLGEVTYKEGQLRVFTDDGLEVQLTHTPKPGHIPIEVNAQGGVKFHPTIKTDEELSKAVVEQQGLGFHLVTWKPLDITQSVVKDLMVSLQSTKSIASRGGVTAWVNSIPGIGYVKTSDNTLSPFEIQQRKTATYSISNYRELLQNEMKYIEDIKRGRVRVDSVTGEDINSVKSYLTSLSPLNKLNARQMYQDFSRTLAAAKDMLNPDTGKPGYFMRTPFEMNDFYQTNFKRSPTYTEYAGYFAFVRNYENDRVFRSLREYTNKARLGGEQHQISYTDAEGKKFDSGFFDAVSKKDLPGGDWPIAVFTGGKVDIQLTSKLGGKYKTIRADVAEGKSVVSELYNPELRPLQTIPGVGHNYIRYVVVNAGDRQTKGLDWNQVNRLSGGHFDYDYEFAVKEAKMMQTKAGNTTIDRYEGDRTLMFGASRSMLQGVVNVLNEVKKQLREKNVPEAKRIFEEGIKGENGPAMSWKDWYSQTSPKKVDGVIHPPVINIHEPYSVVPKGGSILGTDKSLEDRYKRYLPNGKETSTFQDGTVSGSLARQYQVGYTQERDADTMMAIKDVGGKGNPIYKYEPAEFVDPITTMNRALNQITSASFMEDMKFAAMEGWLREAEKYLKADTRDIRASPFYHFNNAKDTSAFKKDADMTTVSNLLSNRFKTQQFLGVPSKWDNFMHDASQKLADWSYDTMGPKGSLVPTWLLDKTTAPTDFLRSMAYHMKMGFFAIPQIFTQSASFVTITSVAPRSAPAATFANLLHIWGKYAPNEESIDLLDHYATKLNMPGFHGWKPGEFKEARQELNNRGFANVGSEYSLLDTQGKQKFIGGEIKGFMDAGQYPFKGTEGFVRSGAWYAAYKDYKADNPGVKVMTRTDWDKVLDKADDMSGNMSRASASVMQSGPLSMTGQFLTYATHLAEFFWSTRMGETTGERVLARARMIAIYSAVFGVPAGLSITGIPTGEALRKMAIENGYNVGDNLASSIFIEGIPATFLAWMTSPDGDPKKGNWYNIGPRLGAGGLTQFSDLLKSDAKWWSFIGGASTAIAYNTWQNTAGMRKATLGNWYNEIGSMMTGNPKDEAFPMKVDDWVDIFKEITMVKNTWAAGVAIQSGKWLSKNETYQTDVSPMNAIFMALSGLNLQEPADDYIVGQAIKDQHEKQKYALNKFTEEFRRGIMSAENNDNTSYKQYMTRAFGYLKGLEYPTEKYNSAIAIASKGWEARISSIREEFYTKNVPAGQEDKRFDAYQKFLQNQELRKVFITKDREGK